MFIKWFGWKIQGSPVIKYTGFHCGCCGKWNDIPFTVPTYLSNGEMDTWGICPDKHIEEVS